MLIFLNCLGVIQNNTFVSYEQLKTLVEEIPRTQARLQQLQLQSKFILQKVCGLVVWKLHESIPHRLVAEKTSIKTFNSVPEEEVV